MPKNGEQPPDVGGGLPDLTGMSIKQIMHDPAVAAAADKLAGELQGTERDVEITIWQQ